MPEGTLYIFSTALEEQSFWVERLRMRDEPMALFIHEQERARVLMALKQAWEEETEEETGEALDYWLGRLWDVPLVRSGLQQLRGQSPGEVLAAIKSAAISPGLAAWQQERDKEARRCFLEFLEPSAELMSLEEWRELSALCRETCLEYGSLPWLGALLTEHDEAPALGQAIGLPAFYARATKAWPPWLAEAPELVATAAQYGARGEKLLIDYRSAQEFGWRVEEVTPAQDEPSELKVSCSKPGAFHQKKLNQQWQEQLKDHIFSVTELQAYQRAPFAYYCERVLKLASYEDESVDLEPVEVGVLVHRVLETYYRDFLKASILPSPDTARLSQILADEMKAVLSDREGIPAFLLERQRQRIERVLVAVLTKDHDDFHSQASPLIPTYFEWEFGRGDKAPLILPGRDGQPLALGGKVDRIDVDPVKKTFLVIDYKTGSRKVTGKDIERGTALQLPIYIRAVQELLLPDYQPIGALYFSLADMSKRDGMLRLDYVKDYFDFSLRSSSLMTPDKWEEVLKESLETAQDVGAEIRAGRFPPCEEICASFCPYQDMCR